MFRLWSIEYCLKLSSDTQLPAGNRYKGNLRHLVVSGEIVPECLPDIHRWDGNKTAPSSVFSEHHLLNTVLLGRNETFKITFLFVDYTRDVKMLFDAPNPSKSFNSALLGWSWGEPAINSCSHTFVGETGFSTLPGMSPKTDFIGFKSSWRTQGSGLYA